MVEGRFRYGLDTSLSARSVGATCGLLHLETNLPANVQGKLDAASGR